MSSLLLTVHLAILIVLFFDSVTCFETKQNRLFRLPNNTFPTFYDINIRTEVDRNDFVFHGIARINFSVVEKTYDIIIHSKLMQLENINLISSGGPISINNYTYDETNEFLSIKSETLLNISNYQLTIKYNSTLRTDKLGFYRSSYLDNRGNSIWLAATQFAPTEARHAFPCYDEPKFKANFQLTITHPNTLIAMSNTDIQTNVDNFDGTNTTVFETTPILPTYLVGFVISNFEKLYSQRTKFNHEMYARVNALNRTQFAEQTAGDILEELMNNFQTVPLPLTTMKQIALPDFHFSGMENFGLVTYKETKIFFDPLKHGSREVLSIVYLLAHEMSHQWFGNLVTMAWWTHVWLKEGFSTLYGYYIPDILYPDCKIMLRYQSAVMHFVFELDAESKIRPMTYYVEEQKAIMKNYDKIAYEKSSCVLRMIDHAVGRDAFKFGVDSYLETFRYKSVDEDDLFIHLEKGMVFFGNNDINITKAFRSWTSQSGYPIVTANVFPDKQMVYLYQERFLNSFDKDPSSLWIIPINYIIKNNVNCSNTKATFWMHDRNSTIEIPKSQQWTKDDWIIFNIEQTGYYRVNYDLTNWNLLVNQLIFYHKAIPSENRAQLVDDSFKIACAGSLSYSVVLNLIRYMENEGSYSSWVAFENNVLFINQKIAEHSVHSKFKAYIRNILVKPFQNEFYNNQVNNSDQTDPVLIQTRNIIFRTSCWFELNECLKWQIEPTDNELRSDYFCSDFKKSYNDSMSLMQILLTEEDVVVRNDLLIAVKCTRDIPFIKFLLQESIALTSRYNISKEERMQIFYSTIQGSIIGLNLALEFILREWHNINLALAENDLNSLIIDASKYVNNQNSRTLFYNVLENVENDQIKKDALKNILSTMEWSIAHESFIETWLDDYKGSSKGIISSKVTHVFVMVVAVTIIITYN